MEPEQSWDTGMDNIILFQLFDKLLLCYKIVRLDVKMTDLLAFAGYQSMIKDLPFSTIVYHLNYTEKYCHT